MFPADAAKYFKQLMIRALDHHQSTYRLISVPVFPGKRERENLAAYCSVAPYLPV